MFCYCHMKEFTAFITFCFAHVLSEKLITVRGETMIYCEK